MTFSLDNCKKLSGSMLKTIAILCMFIDHAALLLQAELSLNDTLFAVGGTNITWYYIMRKIGRLAFPLFCFLLAEGVANTKNAKQYGIRLLVFAFVSEIPFNLMLSGKILLLEQQNIYFTLFLGFLMIYLYDTVDHELKKWLCMAAIMLVAVLLRADYGLRGVLLILLMHVFRQAPAVRAVLAYPLLSGGLAAWASFAPIGLYNGQRGFIQTKAVKFAFYIFYPAHILFLIAIKLLLRQYL